MSNPSTTSRAGTSPSPTSSSTHQSSTKSKPTIIIVAVVGGILLIVALILIIVPFARRRALRRKNNLNKQAEGSSSSDVTSTTVASRREVHNRTLSVDASVPLLEPDSSTSGPEYSRFGATLGNLSTEPNDAHHTQSSTPPTPSSFGSPRLFAPTFSSFSARPPLSDDLEPGPPPRSRFIRSAPQQPLRHTRTRVARVPMDTLPEDLAMDTASRRRPSAATTTTAVASASVPAPSPSPPPSPPPLSHASSRASTSASISISSATTPSAPSPPPASPSPSTNWLHIPKSGGIPLINAFRQSISSVASRGSSLPTMQHYPSFSQSQNAFSGSGGSTRSSQTFYSVTSAGNNNNGVPTTPPPPVPPLPSEHGEIPRPPPPRLKSGSTGERVPQVHHLGLPDGHHAASRQASMVNAVPGSLRPGGKSRPVSSTAGSGSGSSVSMYADARSQIGSAGEDGRWNGSGDGSVGGSSSAARGRQRS